MRAITCASRGKVSIEPITIMKIAITHLRIPQDTRVSVAAKLQDGVNVDKVLDHVRECARYSWQTASHQ